MKFAELANMSIDFTDRKNKLVSLGQIGTPEYNYVVQELGRMQRVMMMASWEMDVDFELGEPPEPTVVVDGKSFGR